MWRGEGAVMELHWLHVIRLCGSIFFSCFVYSSCCICDFFKSLQVFFICVKQCTRNVVVYSWVC
jgi:hypothetical protein